MFYGDWYERARSRMSGHGLWLRGKEINTLDEREFEGRDYRVLFVRLSTYFDTGYSFTHQLLYQLTASIEGVFPDLAYLPPPRDASLFDEAEVPWLLGTQSKRDAREFDLIGFSNSIVQELVNLPTMLKKSQIPLLKSERMKREDIPLLVMGGANSLYTSLLWESDPLVDGIFVGESDTAIRKMIEIARHGKKSGKTKAEILSELEAIPGFFQPERPRKTQKAFIWSLNKSEALEKGPVYLIEDSLGKGHLQISEGCPCFCSFCAESWDRKPYRERSSATLKEVALKMKANMGLDTIELYSFNFNMYSEFYPVLWELAPLFRRIGLKSQRFDLLAHDPKMIEFQHAIEKASITCGLEGISPRLRRYLHKNLETSELHKSLEAIFRSKARELKVFLIATGLEEDQDFDALSDLLGHIASIRQKAQGGTRVIFSITPLVRFPWTPLEFEDAHPRSTYDKIIRQAAKTIRAHGFEFRESADLPEYWVSQVLVRADTPEILKALKETLAETGFVYYREITENFRQAFEKKLLAHGLEETKLLKGHTLEESFTKPWASIETGVKREFLWEEVLRARTYQEIDYCLGRNWQESKCFLCGGCPSKEHILDIVHAKQTRDYSLEDFKERLAATRAADTKVSFLLDVGPLGFGVPRKMVAIALARALMLAFPELAPHYRGFTGSYWDQEDKPTWITGRDCLELFFHREAVPRLAELSGSATAIAAVNSKLGDWGKWQGLANQNWSPSRIELSGQFQFQPDFYLKSQGLKYTLRREENDSYRYDFTAQARKKGIVSELLRSPARVDIAPGPKFNLQTFLSATLKWKEKEDWHGLDCVSKG